MVIQFNLLWHQSYARCQSQTTTNCVQHWNSEIFKLFFFFTQCINYLISNCQNRWGTCRAIIITFSLTLADWLLKGSKTIMCGICIMKFNVKFILWTDIFQQFRYWMINFILSFNKKKVLLFFHELIQNAFCVLFL